MCVARYASPLDWNSRDGEPVDTERLDELERQIAILAGEIEDLKISETGILTVEDGRFGLGPAASKVYGVDRGVSIGGYGEMLYQNFDSEQEDGAPSGETIHLR